MTFVGTRIHADWRSHPRTLAAWEEPWTGGSGTLPKHARAVITELREQEPAYWLSRNPDASSA
jgi:hypothetical protein